MKKHLKCLALFLGICTMYVVIPFVTVSILNFIAAIIGKHVIAGLIVLGILFFIGWLTHSICKEWD